MIPNHPHRRRVGRDLFKIDAEAAILALDNVLEGDCVRSLFHGLPSVRRKPTRLDFTPRAGGTLGVVRERERDNR